MTDSRDISHTTSERTVTSVIGVLSVIPDATGALGILRGPEGAPGGGPTTASVDSEYRFTNTFWLAAGAGLMWSLRAPRERTHTTRTILGVVGAGGFARLLSRKVASAPHPFFQDVTALELFGMPAAIAWHRSVFR